MQACLLGWHPVNFPCASNTSCKASCFKFQIGDVNLLLIILLRAST